jgi:hypothetical protein
MGPDACELMMPSHAVATEEVHDLTAHGAGIMRRYLALIGVAPTRDSRQNRPNYRASLKQDFLQAAELAHTALI